jgi:hypothetical protein
VVVTETLIDVAIGYLSYIREVIYYSREVIRLVVNNVDFFFHIFLTKFNA